MVEKIRAGLGQAQVKERRWVLHEVEPQAAAWSPVSRRAEVCNDRSGGELSAAARDHRRPRRAGHHQCPGQDDERFVAYEQVAEIVSKGTTRSTMALRGGLQVDLRVVEPEEYGAALHYFTGSKAHNVELRPSRRTRATSSTSTVCSRGPACRRENRGGDLCQARPRPRFLRSCVRPAERSRSPASTLPELVEWVTSAATCRCTPAPATARPNR